MVKASSGRIDRAIDPQQIIQTIAIQINALIGVGCSINLCLAAWLKLGRSIGRWRCIGLL